MRTVVGRVVGSAMLSIAILFGLGCSSETTPEPPPVDLDLSALGPEERPVELIVPDGFDGGSPTPVVILLHGFGASGAANDLILNFAGQVDDRDFVLLRPDGTIDSEGRRFWNATDNCCDFFGSGVDDVAYLSSLIEEVGQRFDVSRVGVVGHSNGAYMTQRLACDRADQVDAFASLAGSTWDDAARCQPSEPVAALMIHGTEDPDVLFAGFEGSDERTPYPGAVENTARWANYNGCSDAAESAGAQDFTPDVDGDETLVTQHAGCNDGGTAILWEMVDEGHLPAVNDTWRHAVLDHLLGE